MIYLIDSKIADKITKASKNNSKKDKNEIEIWKERYIFSGKRQQIINESGLV